MSDFKIQILGCGSAMPTTRHQPTSQIIDFRDKEFMVDCGEGAQLQMRRMGLRFSRLTHIFISHLHGDHCFGLPGLISTLGMQDRIGDLVIHGPASIETYLRPVMDLFCRGLDFEVRFETVGTKEKELVLDERSISVYSIPLHHRIPTIGYLFVEKPKEPHIIREMTDFYHVPIKAMKDLKRGEDFVTDDGETIPNSRLTRPAEPSRIYAYCSDTIYKPSIAPLIEGADLLYHEATYNEADASRAKENYHSTARQAAMIARDANVKRLIIGHYSARYDNTETLLAEAREIFPNTIAAEEGLTVDI